MRIGALSRESGVPVATIKYYLREGLVPPGRRTAANQADYDERHVHRLRLIRAFREVGGLGIEPIRRVLHAIDAGDLSLHELFGVAQDALDGPAQPEDPSADASWARAEVDRFLEGLGWNVRVDARGRRALEDAVRGLRSLGRDADTRLFAPYATAADAMARFEVETIPSELAPSDALERMVVGTVVFGRVFDALRRLAHEHHSAAAERRAVRPRRPSGRPARGAPRSRLAR